MHSNHPTVFTSFLISNLFIYNIVTIYPVNQDQILSPIHSNYYDHHPKQPMYQAQVTLLSHKLIPFTVPHRTLRFVKRKEKLDQRILLSRKASANQAK
ncbi:hypothetical protein BC937DRAFT_86920 [Endogone sp. FLAS-F59071]|nr:hypothetical protein BC937DRAFT_86920 [Endogone sp. FLAS-F59071]|eukprot:RUS12824.1 hypothetical protein BC937DRAFT_86920 [Endogone sp. FLAS-F59071]